MREFCILALAKFVPKIQPIISETEMNELLPTLRNLRIGLDRIRE